MDYAVTVAIHGLKKDAPNLDTLERNFSQLLANRLATDSPVDVVCFCESLPLSGIVGIADGTSELVSEVFVTMPLYHTEYCLGRTTSSSCSAKTRSQGNSAGRPFKHD
jgi:hypothetical protein